MNQGPPQRRIHLDRPDGTGLDLLVSGFRHQQLLSVDELLVGLEILPPSHLAGLQVIKYYERHGGSKPVSGHYVRELRGIILYDFKSRRDAFETLYHEIGHYVYFNVLPAEIRASWGPNYHRREGFVSDYAATNIMEGFAETYMAYVLHGPALATQFPAKHGFMRDEVFQGWVPNVVQATE